MKFIDDRIQESVTIPKSVRANSLSTKSLKYALGIILFLILISSSVVRFISRPIYDQSFQSVTQNDFAINLAFVENAFSLEKTFADDFIAESPKVPYLPVIIPLFHLFSQMPWNTAKLSWFVLCLMIHLFLVLYCFLYHKDIFNKKELLKLFALILISWVFFNGTHLALFTGNLSTLSSLLLILSFCFHEKKTHLASILLAIATYKINLVIPFFIFALYKKKYRYFFFSCIYALLFNIITLIIYSSPIEYFSFLVDSFSTLNSISTNDFRLMSASGREDMASFLYLLGIDGTLNTLIRVVIVISLLVYTFTKRNVLDSIPLLLCLNSIFFLTMYHRSYDFHILLFFLIPIAVKNISRVKLLHILLFTSFFIPIFKIADVGIKSLSGATVLFESVGVSYFLKYLGIVLFFLVNVANVQDNSKQNSLISK